MKRIIVLTTAIVMLAVGPAFSHCGTCGVGEPAGEAKGSKAEKSSKTDDWKEKKIAAMTAKLGLSDEQVNQVDAIMTEKMAKKKAVHAETGEKMKAIRADYKEKIKGVLTPEQMAKYEAMKEEKGSSHDHDHSHGKGSGKGSKGSH